MKPSSIKEKNLNFDFLSSRKMNNKTQTVFKIKKKPNFNFIKQEKPSLTIKYIGEIQGTLGVATKQIFESSKCRNDHMNRIFLCKENSSKSSLVCRLPSTLTTRKVPGLRGCLSLSRLRDINSKVADFTVKDSISRNYHTNNLRTNPFLEFTNTKLVTPRTNNHLNGLISNYKSTGSKVKKSKVVSESERVFPDRYSKPTIKMTEYIIRHKASIRNYPEGKKCSSIKNKNKI